MEVVLALLAALIALMAAAALLFWCRHRLKQWMATQLVEAAGPGIVRSMAPRDVVAALLAHLYGGSVPHDDLLVGILGGPGLDPKARDTAISTGTTTHITLTSLDDKTVQTDYRWTHSFSEVQNNHFLVLFGTTDKAILRAIVSNRVFPLFELWGFQNEDQLEDFVPELVQSLKVGISYRDDAGVVRDIAPTRHAGREVPLREFGDFVRLPKRADPGDLRIVQLDLHDLADPDDVVEAIESFSINVRIAGSLDLGYVSWSPPHPCFVRKVSFDVARLPRPGDRYEYLVLNFTLKQGGVPFGGGWMSSADTIEYDADAWMLPGHGVTLVWRLVDNADGRLLADGRHDP